MANFEQMSSGEKRRGSRDSGFVLTNPEQENVASTGKNDAFAALTASHTSRLTISAHDESLRDPAKRLCQWYLEAGYSEGCKVSIPAQARRDSKFCSKRCRQASWRFRIGRSDIQATGRPMRFAYADPPYPGKSKYYAERREVDHASLLERLRLEHPDGWALSTSAEALRDVLLLCPPSVRVCAWFKGPRPTKSRRALVSWEPLIVFGGRPLCADVVCDVADGLIAQGRYRAFPGAMIGMKPPAFAEWMFRQLGASRHDRLDDLFPGSGAIGVAWARYTGVAPAGATQQSVASPGRDDTSPVDVASV